MADEHRPRQRYGEAFWRAHHEAWKRSDLNQRAYCEAQDIPHVQRPSHEPPRRSAALELEPVKRRHLTHVSGMDAYSIVAGNQVAKRGKAISIARTTIASAIKGAAAANICLTVISGGATPFIT